MTTHKKLGLRLGLGLAVIFTGLAFSFFWSGKLLAYTADQINANGATTKYNFTAKDAKTITMRITGKTLHFDLTDPTTFSGPNIVAYTYQLKDTEDTNDNCRVGGVGPLRPQGETASISILRSAIDTNPGSKIAANLTFFHKVGGNCVDDQVVGDIKVNNSFGKDLVVAGGTGGTPSDGATGTDDACYQSSSALAWLFCPLISAAQAAAHSMYGFVEDQLKFTVSQSNTEKDSLGSPETRKGVHDAWSSFRILASSLVVILLLVMVISQAIGTGPFDAYTIRKMLPRLVMGVILIQISWPVFSWMVNTVDHLGIGLADIMYAPFHGASKMDLFSLLGPFGNEAIAFNWVGIGALVIFGIAAPFVVLGLILAVLVAIFVGFLTLLFRKILIIMALIFVPVALISWMMPNDGLRKYWKLWWDNFIKALMMFPLIIAMIAAGRIFAKIGSGQSDFVGFFIVLVGFFGPLFILPKTFKWGGTVMQLAGNAMTKAQTATLKRPQEFLKSRQEGYKEERRRQSQERVARGEGFNLRRPWRLPVDRALSGRWDPTLWGRRKQRALDTYIAKGAESEEADVKAADSRTSLLLQQVSPEQHDALAQALAEGNESHAYTTFDDQTHTLGKVTMAQRRAGLNALARLGGDTNFRATDRIMNELNNGTAEERAMAKKVQDANVSTLLPKMKHLYFGTDRDAAVRRTVGSLSETSFTSMEGAEMEATLEVLSHQAAHGVTLAERDQAAQNISTTLTYYQSAIDNENIRPNIASGVNRAVEAFVDGANLRVINADRTTAGLRPIVRTTLPGTPPVVTHAAIAPVVANLSGRIDPSGNVHP